MLVIFYCKEILQKILFFAYVFLSKVFSLYVGLFIEHNKKETAITVSLQDKQCVNAIDRGNKKSYTALHIACKEGHAVSSYCCLLLFL